MFCESCGNEMQPGEKFCRKCGAKVAEVEQQAQPQQQFTAHQPAQQQFQAGAQQQYTQQPYQAAPHKEMKVGPLDVKKMGLLSILGGLFMFIGTFLPVMKVSALGMSESINFFNGEELSDMSVPAIGWLVLIVGLVTIALGVLGKRLFSLISAGVALVFTLIMFFPTISAIGDAKDSMGLYSSLANVSLGFGYWLIFIGVILAVVDFVLDKKNIQLIK
ncbi:MAG: zinc ribbon domain-containing protein [Lachnospira sp.]|nr:zinc ribbon domain-containing protein [Lachnospira sp.]